MRNCKEEFLLETGDKEILCAKLITGRDYLDDEERTFTNLKVGYTHEDYCDFLNAINCNYDSGYGGQCLYGFIWYKDGTWSARGEYDGSSWWEYIACPKIPDALK